MPDVLSSVNEYSNVLVEYAAGTTFWYPAAGTTGALNVLVLRRLSERHRFVIVYNYNITTYIV